LGDEGKCKELRDDFHIWFPHVERNHFSPSGRRKTTIQQKRVIPPSLPNRHESENLRIQNQDSTLNMRNTGSEAFSMRCITKDAITMLFLADNIMDLTSRAQARLHTST
jgi:hypothetical protein